MMNKNPTKCRNARTMMAASLPCPRVPPVCGAGWRAPSSALFPGDPETYPPSQQQPLQESVYTAHPLPGGHHLPPPSRLCQCHSCLVFWSLVYPWRKGWHLASGDPQATLVGASVSRNASPPLWPQHLPP